MVGKRRVIKPVIAVLFAVMVLIIAGCNGDTGEQENLVPEIQGVQDEMIVWVGDVFDPYAGVSAYDPIDGDLTDQIIILGINDFPINSNKVLTTSGTYTLEYRVVNSSGKMTTKELDVTVRSYSQDISDYEVGEYELVFSDEFNYTGLPDSDKWSFQTGGGGFGNNEIQYYTDRLDNAFVEDGKLTLRLIKEDYSNREYTSAKIWTRNIESWTYGKFEIRAKVPAGVGTWPAIWMMPQNSLYGGWPKSGEIDIMEYVGYDPNTVHGTIHTERYNGMDGTQQGRSFALETAEEEFHVYSIEWLPDKIIWSVDGQEFFTYRFVVGALSNIEESDYWTIWPYNQDFYLILNFAFGGDWGGVQGIDSSITQADFVIDYVRVYQGTELEASLE